MFFQFQSIHFFSASQNLSISTIYSRPTAGSAFIHITPPPQDSSFPSYHIYIWLKIREKLSYALTIGSNIHVDQPNLSFVSKLVASQQ